MKTVDYSHLFATLPDSYVIFAAQSPDFTMLAANQAYLKVTAKSADEIIGKKLFDIFPDTSEEAVTTGKGELQRSLEKVIETKKPDSTGVIRYDLADENGVLQVRYWQATHSPIFEDDEVVAIIQSTADVTEKRESEERLRFLADTMPQLVWITRPDGFHEYYNKHWYEYTGTIEGSTDGEGWKNLFHNEDQARANELWQHSLKTGEPYEVKYRLYHAPSGTYRWVIGRALPFRSDSGEITKWYGTCTDIDDSIKEIEKRKLLQKELREEKKLLESRVAERTSQLKLTNEGLRDEIKKRHEVEQTLRDYSAELQRSNNELEEFAYVSSHDLQEPLRKIQAFSDLLVEEFGHELGDGREYLDRIQSSAKRMSTLIEDLLAFSRVSTKPAVNKRVDLTTLVTETINDLDARIRKEKGSIVVESELPTVFADETHMRQLFQNLLSNGLKFHAPDVSPEVKVNYQRTDDAHIIKISDNGIGIEEKYLEKIFAVFQRLHAKQAFDGTGIGLAVCKKIVERYGGTIKVESTVGKGTTFIISLPAKV